MGSRLAPSRAEGDGRLGAGLALLSGLAATAAVVAGLVVCFAAVHRGLDLTDESYYILSELHPKTYLRSFTEFQVVVGPVLSIVRYVWVLRVVKLAALVAANLFLAWAFVTTAPTLLGSRFRRVDRLAVGAAVVAGALLPSTLSPQTPGYNETTAWIVTCGSALLLLLADKRVPRAGEPVAWMAVGVLTWLQLLVKWPAAVAMAPLAVLAVVRTRPRPWSIPRSVAAVVAGLVASALVTWFVVAPLPELIRGIHRGSTALATFEGHQTGKLLRSYVSDLWDIPRTIVPSYWYLLVAAVAAGALVTTRRFARAGVAVAALGLCVLTPVLVVEKQIRGGVLPTETLLNRLSVLMLYVVLVFVSGAVATTIRSRRPPSLRKVLLVASFLMTPFLSALGTNNAIWFNAFFLAGFWVLAALAVASTAFGRQGRPLVHGFALASATLIAFMAFDGTWHHPYRQLPLSADVVTVGSDGPLSGLVVDPATATFIREVRAEVRASSGRLPPTMVVWSGIPGAVVAGRVVQPAYAWVTPYTAPALTVMATSCAEHHRGVLLVGFPTDPRLLNGTEAAPPAACETRTWIRRPNIAVPKVYGSPPGGLTVFFSPPAPGTTRRAH